ncbi:hypothetical protein SUGI_0238260 [Cryptomeria japonica]|uniref:zeatin O-xylosyltransferase n=1 Tax=Cryptomeria japonica TaxID=3369 RepID=UPI002408EB02|nr:zeatin O-xylosyltransferase [Cryptomeria japonica]GLJ14698.1 hypothetical protein SUGI_0238260 [Cryptomeria japonica]
MDSDKSGSRKLHVLVVSYPAQGHLNQLLHFSRAIAERGGITVTFAATSTHIHQVLQRLDGWDPQSFDIQFKELPMPMRMPNLSVGELDLQTSHTFPLHLIPLFEALEDFLNPFLDLLMGKICSESNNRVVLVYDAGMAWIQALATKYGIPAYVFIPAGAYQTLWFAYKLSGQTAPLPPVNISLKRCLPERHLEFVSRQSCLREFAKGQILNTCSAMESKFISRLREERIFCGKPVWTLGPLLPPTFFNEDPCSQTQRADRECMRWLDRQLPQSVVYVSFGTMSCFPVLQIRELAEGLERSRLAFLWVLRIPDGAHFSTEGQSDWISKCLPEGYEGRLGGRGFIAGDWVPQLEILFHKAIGGFLSHCGWNSTVESISAGVPMVAWPLHSDQFANSALIEEELKVGVQVKEWRNAEENELVSAEEVEKGLKRLMISEEGMQMRKMAQELRDEARRAVGEGGSSLKDLDSLISHSSGQFSS